MRILRPTNYRSGYETVAGLYEVALVIEESREFLFQDTGTTTDDERSAALDSLQESVVLQAGDRSTDGVRD